MERQVLSPRALGRDRLLVALGIAALVVVFFGLPVAIGEFNLYLVNSALLVMVGVVALQILTGMTGLVSLGHVAFLALGAVIVAASSVLNDAPMGLALVLCLLVGGLVGLVVAIPVLRLRGLYLILATFALHFIAIYFFTKFQLRWFGSSGILYPDMQMFGATFDSEWRWYWICAPLAILSVTVLRNLLRSREGRALVAIHSHEVAAASFGVRLTRSKVSAFVLTSAMVTLSGGLIALHVGGIAQESLGLATVIQYYLMLIIGGMGANVAGPVLGVVTVSIVQEWVSRHGESVLAAIPIVGDRFGQNSSFIDPLITSLMLILILIFMPGGLVELGSRAKALVQRIGGGGRSDLELEKARA